MNPISGDELVKSKLELERYIKMRKKNSPKTVLLVLVQPGGHSGGCWAVVGDG